MILINILIFLLGLILLVKGSDFLVKAAAGIANHLGVSELVIGLTLVALGTSIPELASSVIAALKEESGLVIGNVVGSNIANIGLIIGLGALLATIKTRKEMLKRDGYIMLFAALIFYAIISNGLISRIEALLFLLLYVAYTVFLFEGTPKCEDDQTFSHFMRYFLGFKYLVTIKNCIRSNHTTKNKKETTSERITEKSKIGLIKDLPILAISGFAVVIGANFLVNEAIFFAEFFDLPKTVIGITLLAVGTSLPELGVTAVAVRRGYGDIAVGNVLGSNIVNIFLVAGVSAVVFPLSVIKSTVFYSTPFMIVVSLLLLIFIKTDWELRRIEGIAFLILYTIFLAVLFAIT